MLVDRDRVQAVAHFRAQDQVGELERVELGVGLQVVGGDSERSDRVPHHEVPGDERVAAHDPRDEPGAPAAAEYPHQEVLRVADPVQVLGDLRDPAVRSGDAPLLLVGRAQAVRREVAGQIQEELEDVRPVAALLLLLLGLPGSVPRPVRTEHDGLHALTGGLVNRCRTWNW